MPPTTGVAILATDLAITDRRALSQAWYSALHVAERAPATTPRACAGQERQSTTAVRPSAVAPASAQRRACAPSTNRLRRATPGRGAVAGPGLERRAPQTELAGRIERFLARRAQRGVPASFAVRVAGGRVHLLVRSDGARTRVVAVCAASVRERVDRALAHARFALAAGRTTEVG